MNEVLILHTWAVYRKNLDIVTQSLWHPVSKCHCLCPPGCSLACPRPPFWSLTLPQAHLCSLQQNRLGSSTCRVCHELAKPTASSSCSLHTPTSEALGSSERLSSEQNLSLDVTQAYKGQASVRVARCTSTSQQQARKKTDRASKEHGDTGSGAAWAVLGSPSPNPQILHSQPPNWETSSLSVCAYLMSLRNKSWFHFFQRLGLLPASPTWFPR